jgi:hypothetical protein
MKPKTISYEKLMVMEMLRILLSAAAALLLAFVNAAAGLLSSASRAFRRLWKEEAAKPGS